ncbi:MAG: sulfatase/phosphatase domain-containing protein, partial [Pseudomonadota bacterium]|nr:sulfatase/phosphatase domain-containing protein [Pseudomonadota bacterium]
FLGDHWMGEKTFFQDASTRVPLIIYDPSPEADATRGTVCDDLVESIDLAPTFVDIAGGDADALGHILEGRSLMPVLHGTQQGPLRDFAICEYDYSAMPLAQKLGVSTRDAVLFMVATKRWKMIHAEGGFPPILFDLLNDPDELVDLGQSAEHAEVRAELYNKLNAWARRPSQRTTRSDAQLVEMRTKSRGRGIVLGVYDEADIAPELTVKYRNRKADDRRDKG